MRRTHFYINNYGRSLFYGLFFILTFLSFLTSFIMAKAEDDGYNIYSLSDFSWAYSAYPLWYDIPGYLNQNNIQPRVLSPISSDFILMGQYMYLAQSAADRIRSNYTFNAYTNPDVYAIPARVRNILFEYWFQTTWPLFKIPFMEPDIWTPPRYY